MAPRRTPRKAISHEEAWEKIQGARHINNQHLKKNQEKALKAIKSPPVTEKGKKFHKRLNEVRAKCNRDGDHDVHLCCIGLTQSLVVDMNKDQWSLLLDKLEKEKNEPVSKPNNNIIYEQASLNGIASIFDSRLCEMIKKNSNSNRHLDEMHSAQKPRQTLVVNAAFAPSAMSSNDKDAISVDLGL